MTVVNVPSLFGLFRLSQQFWSFVFEKFGEKKIKIKIKSKTKMNKFVDQINKCVCARNRNFRGRERQRENDLYVAESSCYNNIDRQCVIRQDAHIFSFDKIIIISKTHTHTDTETERDREKERERERHSHISFTFITVLAAYGIYTTSICFCMHSNACQFFIFCIFFY